MPLEINYCNLRGHESMLRDSVRCEAFRRAIVDTVTPGCAVLDIGAGKKNLWHVRAWRIEYEGAHYHVLPRQNLQ